MVEPTRADTWLADRHDRFGVQVRDVPLAACSDWRIQDGELRHTSGRFFQVIGAEANTPDGSTSEWLLMRQEEVGLLAFLVRPSPAGNEWLLQAKSEPGNVGGAHIAPTVQATQSNFQRVHGGAATQFLEWFVERGSDHIRGDVLASENGTRFLRKTNRNAIAVVPADHRGPAGGAFEWFAGSELRPQLARSYVVGTEARSVIVSAPWSFIADGQPFRRWRRSRGFGRRLAASYETDPNISSALAELASHRASARIGAREVPLEELRGWAIDEAGIHPLRGRAVSVRYVAVVARDREVSEWCQPLMGFEAVSGSDIVCQVRDGVLRFLLRRRSEPGLVGGVELGPSRQSDFQVTLDRAAGERVRLSIQQSDEGGRFWRCRRRYRIVEREVGLVDSDEPGDHWLTLAQLESLARTSTTLTNEARTTLSVLLSMA